MWTLIGDENVKYRPLKSHPNHPNTGISSYFFSEAQGK